MAEDSESWDYVVVGSGSAGAVVAARLSEDPRNRVLLLEAGPANKGPWSKIPLGFGKMLYNPEYLWSHTSEPEAGLGGRQISLAHGRIAGGSSAVNGMVYVRGFPYDYALWRQLGAEGWSYEDVLPYFRKAEHFERGGNEYHGDAGPLGVESSRWRNPMADAFIAAAGSLGIPPLEDLAGAKQQGVGYHDLTTWRGQRSSTWHAYLEPNLRRSNLRLVTGAFVRRIDFTGKQASGVTCELDGKEVSFRATGEVIISAGALHSPKLLQLSGIGPGERLTGLGIPVVHDLSGVGENLMDHIQVGRAYKADSQHSINRVMANPGSMLLAGLKYYLNRSGPLTVGAALAGGFASTREGLEAPDIQIAYTPVMLNPETPGVLTKESGFLLSTYRLRPESRGHVRIASPDPHAPAAIALNALSAESDRAVLIEGLRMLRRIAEAEPLRRFAPIEVTPGLQGDSDNETSLLAHAQQAGATSYHYSGTARIGTDDQAVVDRALRVHGIGGLRVIDASVMPTVTSGNTNAASIMIGEKGADHILAAQRG